MNYPEKQVNNFAKIERKDNTMIHKKFIKIAYPCKNDTYPCNDLYIKCFH
jgi:hypothetical protein